MRVQGGEERIASLRGEEGSDAVLGRGSRNEERATWILLV